MTFDTMRIFTEEELRKYDGSNDSIYIAYNGKVYDVSTSYHWRGGIHHARHHAGRNLTDALELAPHGIDLLQKFPIVGNLAECENPTA